MNARELSGPEVSERICKNPRYAGAVAAFIGDCSPCLEKYVEANKLTEEATRVLRVAVAVRNAEYRPAKEVVFSGFG